MNKETIVNSAFHDHRSKFSYSLAAAALDGHFEHPASHSCAITIRKITVGFEHKLNFSAAY